MGVILDTNWRFWNATKQSDDVGWPAPVTAQQSWAYQRIAAAATEYANAGFSAIKLPPSCLGAAGIFSDGYDKYDDYALDGTAFGSAEMLRQCVGAINAHGMQAYGDLVLHQYDGGKNGVYPTKRFPKTPTCFSGAPPRVAADPVPDTAGDFAFGDLAAYVHALPAGYMHDGAIAATEFLARTAGFAGFRLDDVKGTNAQVLWDMLHTPGVLSELFAVGEYFDGNPTAVGNWVNGYMTGRASVYDFAFKFNVGDICNNNSRQWMGALGGAIGYLTMDNYRSVTFIESADSDNSPGQQTIWNKILGYAIMLTFPGYPQVYYRDWSDDPGCYGLKKWINNLIWIHEKLAQGEFVVRLDTNEQVFVHERLGHGDAIGCVCFFNNDQYSTHTVTVQTNLGPWQEVHEYTGNGPYNNIWTDGEGRLTATVPRNNNGHAYLVYAKPLKDGGIPLMWTPRLTQQTFYGAADLPIAAASNANQVIGRIDVAAGSPVDCTLTADHTGWADHSSIAFLVDYVANPTSNPAGGSTLDVTAAQATSRSTAALTGWYEIHVAGGALPLDGSAFELTVSYMAPQTPTPWPLLAAPTA